MSNQKLSISVSQEQFDFIENYQAQHQFKTRSQVISQALYLLQQLQLQSYYREANQELQDDFDITTSDGLEDETW